MQWRALMWVLWPSFLMAGVASAIVFALVDPLDVAIFGYIRLERDFLYASGFFFLAHCGRSQCFDAIHGTSRRWRVETGLVSLACK